MPRKKVQRARDKHCLPLEVRTSKVDDIFGEFADACRKLFADVCQRLSEEMAVGGQLASGASDEYRDVPGWPGYHVNARGRVQSCWASNGMRVPIEWHTLQPFLAEGRRFVRLSRNGIIHDRQAGELVLLAWSGSPPSGKRRIRHINERMDDDRLENLEWCERKQMRPANLIAAEESRRSKGQ